MRSRNRSIERAIRQIILAVHLWNWRLTDPRLPALALIVNLILSHCAAWNLFALRTVAGLVLGTPLDLRIHATGPCTESVGFTDELVKPLRQHN